MNSQKHIGKNIMIQLDYCRRNSYVKLKFSGECKDSALLSLVGDLERLGIGYSNGIDEDPDTIMLSIVNYIQLRELVPKYKMTVLESPALTIDVSYCKIDLVNYVEIPFRLSCSLADFFADGCYIEINQLIKIGTEGTTVRVTFRVYLWGTHARCIVKYYKNNFNFKPAMMPVMIKSSDYSSKLSMKALYGKVYQDLLSLDILGEEWIEQKNTY